MDCEASPAATDVTAEAGEVDVEDRPPCKECERPWMVPRPVVYKLSPCVPKHVPPTTTDMVVAYQSVDQTCRPHFPEQVFKTIEITSSRHTCFGLPAKHRLVKDFRYNSTTGEVFDGNSADGDKYARLITLNSWYYRLAHTLLYVSFSVVDLQTNFLLVIRTFYDPDMRRHEELQLVWPWLIAAYGLMLLACVGLSFSDASRGWAVHTSPKKGDLILGLHWFDTWTTFVAMMMFSFFSVEGMVTELMVLLHPWKGVQPYAAIKLHNARAYTIGWGTRPMFSIENKPNAAKSLPAQLVCKIYIFALKLYVCYLFPRRVDVVIAAISSVPSLLMGCRKFLSLHQDRRKLKSYLLKSLNDPLLAQGPQKAALEKMLFRIFGEKYESGKTTKQDNGSFQADGVEAEGRCTTCGREHHNGGVSTYMRQGAKDLESNCYVATGKTDDGGSEWIRNGDLRVSGHASWIPEAAELSVSARAQRSRLNPLASAHTLLWPSQPEFEPKMTATMTMPCCYWKMVREAEDQGRDFALIFGQCASPEPLQNSAQPNDLRRERAQRCPVVVPSKILESESAPNFTGPSSKPPALAMLPPGGQTQAAKSDTLAESPSESCRDPGLNGSKPSPLTQPCPGLQSDDAVDRDLDSCPSGSLVEPVSDLRAAAKDGLADPRGAVG